MINTLCHLETCRPACVRARGGFVSRFARRGAAGHPAGHPGLGGFTLIELLVVLAIITIIVSITLPAIGKAKESARRTKCLVNLKSIGTSLQMYMDQESKGLLPKVRPLNDGGNENDPSLLDVMSKYSDAAMPFRENGDGDWIVPDPWKCPSDMDSGDAANGNKPMWQITGTSYEYAPAFVMVAAELLFVRNPQHGVSKAYENFRPPLAIAFDADDWHNTRFLANRRSDSPSDIRWERNGVFYGDWRADKVPFLNSDDQVRLMNDVFQFGGGFSP